MTGVGTAPLAERLSGLDRAGEALRAIPPPARAASLADHADRWLSGRQPELQGVVDRIAATSGYTPPVIREGLAAHFGALTRSELERWLAGHPDAGAGGGRVVIVAAGNIPGVALFPAVGALLAGRPVVVKTSAAEPHLLPAWIETLRARHPAIGSAILAVEWRGRPSAGDAPDDAVGALVLGDAERILAFGHDETVADLSHRYPGRVTGFGTGRSVAVVEASCANDDTADRLALDIALWDQQGCLSPEGAWVVGDEAAARQLAHRLGRAMERIEARLPMGRVSPAEAAALRTLRADLEARELAGEDLEVDQSGEALLWTTWFDPDPAGTPSARNRSAWVRPVGSLDELCERLAAERRESQGAGLAVPAAHREEFADRLRRAGVPFVTELGRMQAPPVDWPNKGRDLLALLGGGAA